MQASKRVLLLHCWLLQSEKDKQMQEVFQKRGRIGKVGPIYNVLQD
jgi:hypothetical protein